jgi:hypothetical protein
VELFIIFSNSAWLAMYKTKNFFMRRSSVLQEKKQKLVAVYHDLPRSQAAAIQVSSTLLTPCPSIKSPLRSSGKRGRIPIVERMERLPFAIIVEPLAQRTSIRVTLPLQELPTHLVPPAA